MLPQTISATTATICLFVYYIGGAIALALLEKSRSRKRSKDGQQLHKT